MNTMNYKGYAARIEFDERDDIFVGHLAGIHDIVGFHADTVKELHVAFEEAVDDYIETCEKIGREPQKPASGKLMLRVQPEVHAAALRAAALTGKSLNQWAAKIIKEAVGI